MQTMNEEKKTGLEYRHATSPMKTLRNLRISDQQLLGETQRLVELHGKEIFQVKAVERQAEKLSVWLKGENKAAGYTFLMLFGNVGTGKTTLAKAIMNIFDEKTEKKMCFQTARELCNMAKNDYESFQRLIAYPYLVVDDVGEEPVEVLNYGYPIFPIRELIEKRYDLDLPTIFTTNLKKNDLYGRYGERVADRLRQITAFVGFPGESLRNLTK